MRRAPPVDAVAERRRRGCASMAILAALFALGSRFAGKVLTTALGWASTLLFGRVPADRQPFVLGISFGSVIWLVLLFGVVFPDVGAFLLVLVPPQDLVGDDVIRIAMFIGVLVVPAVVGLLLVALAPGGLGGRRDALTTIARGYPLTVTLAAMLILLAGLAIWRKGTSLVRGRRDEHVPVVIGEGAYDRVVADLDRALTHAGLEMAPRNAPALMSTPGRWLARIAGRDATSLVPERMIELRGTDLDLLLYPMDILISGKGERVDRARAAIAKGLTTADAHLTISAEAQRIEDRVRTLAPTGDDAALDADTEAAFASIDAEIDRLRIPYDEWEVLYRQRLQVERDRRKAAMAASPGASLAAAAGLAGVEGLVREGAAIVREVAEDDRLADQVDEDLGPVAGTAWRALAGAVAASIRAIIGAGKTGGRSSTR